MLSTVHDSTDSTVHISTVPIRTDHVTTAHVSTIHGSTVSVTIFLINTLPVSNIHVSTGYDSTFSVSTIPEILTISVHILKVLSMRVSVLSNIYFYIFPVSTSTDSII